MNGVEHFLVQNLVNDAHIGQPKPKPSLKPELSQLGLKVAINFTLIFFLSSSFFFFFE